MTFIKTYKKCYRCKGKGFSFDRKYRKGMSEYQMWAKGIPYKDKEPDTYGKWGCGRCKGEGYVFVEFRETD